MSMAIIIACQRLNSNTILLLWLHGFEIDPSDYGSARSVI
jgi:hypothetical protein